MRYLIGKNQENCCTQLIDKDIMHKRLIVKLCFGFFFYCITIQVFANSLITVSEPTGSGVFDIKCDLEYSEQALLPIIHDLRNRYGFDIWANASLADVHFNLEGDPNVVDTFIYELCKRNNVQFNLMYDAKARMVGLSGKKDEINTIMNILQKEFSITNIERNYNTRIDLHGRQMPYGEVVYHLAEKSGLGISYRNGMELLRNNRRVLSYTIAEPFHIYVSKESTTRKLVIDLFYGPNFLVEDNSEIELTDVILCINDKVVTVPGRNIVAEQSVRYPGRIEWISDGPVGLNDQFTIKGTIQGLLLRREYQVDNLQMDSTIKNHDLAVGVYKASVEFDDKPVLGVYWVPDTVEGDWMCVEIETHGLLSEEEKKFIRGIEDKKKKGVYPSREIMEKYETLAKEKMSILRVVSIGKPAFEKQADDDFFDTVFGRNLPAIIVEEANYLRKYKGVDLFNYRYSADATEVFFDSVQDGEIVFPIGIHIRKYQPAKIEFNVSNRKIWDK